VCPFCQASPFVLPLLCALAIGMSGCNNEQERRAAAEVEAKRREQVELDEAKRHLEEEKKKLEARKLDALRSADIYGTPPLRDVGPIDAGKQTKKNCNCPPGDPLCDCF
jgi:hypothetical protein